MRRRPRIFYGWWVVVVSCFVGMFGNGSISQGFPRFFTPIQTDLGLTSAQMSLVFSLARAEGSAGGAADRVGGGPFRSAADGIGWRADGGDRHHLPVAGGHVLGVAGAVLGHHLPGQERRIRTDPDGGGESVVRPPAVPGDVHADDGICRRRRVRRPAAEPGHPADRLAGHPVLDRRFHHRDDHTGVVLHPQPAGGYGDCCPMGTCREMRRLAGLAGAAVPPAPGSPSAKRS